MIRETVILAGGRGERLKPLTDSLPKPLLPVNKLPVLSRVLREVEKCGITAMDAMVVGTINSARLCGVEDSLGSVTVGKKAHFAVFAENPAEDIHAAMDCCMTVKNGEILWQK